MFADRIQAVNFVAHTSKEIKSLAVKKITNPETYDQLLHPNYSGLYDPALGPCDRDEPCDTCGLNNLKCPGHFGFIELPLPVYHPMFFKLMVQILRGSCMHCHRFISKASKNTLFIRQCELLDQGFLTEASNLKDLYNSFTSEASEQSATEVNLEELIVEKINRYYEEIVTCGSTKFTEFTKNLIKCKMDIIKEFISKNLLNKVKECPHCKQLKRDVRSEYNARIFLKSASQKAVQKAVNTKMMNSLKKNSRKQVKNVKSEEQNKNEKQNEGMQDLLDGEEEEDGDDGNEESEDVLKKKLMDQEFITPEEVKKHVIELWKNNEHVLLSLLGSHNSPIRHKKVTTPEIFFLDVVAVPPSRFRPQSVMGEKRFENPQTANLVKVLWHCKLVEEIMKRLQEPQKEDEKHIPVVLYTSQGFQKKGGGNYSVGGKTYQEQLNNAWSELQNDVNMFMDNTLSKLATDALPGVRQLLEKKEGLFRKHMMGKRVNYACRSVISPDPYINTDEIGIPIIFASKLTYVQPVTMWNLSQLTQMVINGPKKYPGAMMIEYEDGRKTILSDNENERRAVAKQLLTSSVTRSSSNDDRIHQEKKVHRHLINGDVLLLNRQPTLHRPSIMAHKAKVLPKERTLRLHYANCKSYNADFDGDEMNAHFPQNELGRAEAYNLVSTNSNYLSPKDGKPLAGLIQDHVVSGVRMTSRDSLFNQEEYQQLIYSGLIDTPGRIKILKPCIYKPQALWSGKQIFSTVLLNILPKGSTPMNMNGNRAKVSDNNWPKGKGNKSGGYQDDHVNDPFLIENQVIIRGGELMTGLLDKTQYGSTPFGLIHCVYELYGGETSGKLLSVLARLFTTHLQHTGFTLGVQDILVLAPAEEKRREIINEGRLCGNASAMEALNLPEDQGDSLHEKLQEAHHNNQGSDLKLLDLSMKSRTDAINNKINGVCMKGLLKKFPLNALQLMVQSGAKGSSVNCMQISCLLGQIELEGRRPPLSMSGRSLPSFEPYDTSPRAGGFVDGRFLTGIRPQEYFFHCMAGREGLVDTAVKTSRSGYLQRCLIKHLEALYVQYDLTVRDGDGSVVQFLYGDDGIDVLKSQYLQNNQFKTIAQNYHTYVSLLNPSKVSEAVDVKKARKLQKRCDRWKRKHGTPYSSNYSHRNMSPYLAYERDHIEKVNKKHPSKARKLGRTEVCYILQEKGTSQDVDGKNQEKETSSDVDVKNQAQRKLMSKWQECDGPSKEQYVNQLNAMIHKKMARFKALVSKFRYILQHSPCPDPVISKLSASNHFGAISEQFQDDVHKFAEQNPENLLVEEDDEAESKRISKETFLPLMWIKYMRSMVQPGEAVGLLAGQSIGEPSTQMTLNTFHFAGRGDMNVTLGIPRLREILMTASENIKTPQMDILVQSGQETEAKKIAIDMNKLFLIRVLQHISVRECLSRSHTDHSWRCRQFKVRLEILPRYAYQDDFGIEALDIMHYIEKVFIKRVCTTVAKIIRTKEKARLVESRVDDSSRIARSRDGDENNDQVAPDEPDDLADLSDDDAGDDGDAANMKNRDRQKQFTSYDDPEEMQAEKHEGEQETNVEQAGLDVVNEALDESSIQLEEDIKPNIPHPATSNPSRIQGVLSRDRHVIQYSVDVDNQWCEFVLQFPLAGSKLMLVSILEKLAEKSVVHEAPGITRSMVTESRIPGENGRYRLKTEGVNIHHLWQYPDILDLKSLYSNNIHAIAKSYGIEAARSVIITEISNVFKVYGIHIDPRHLSLVADYMTFEGVYKPFNRIGIESNPFPFQKMSFETSTHFLRTATAFGQPDDLGSPSSRIVVGRVIGQGTGMVDLLPQIKI